MAPFYGWGSTAWRLEPIRGGSLLFTTTFPEIPGTHFIDLRRMKGHPVVLSMEPQDWESSALSTRPFLHFGLQVQSCMWGILYKILIENPRNAAFWNYRLIIVFFDLQEFGKKPCTCWFKQRRKKIVGKTNSWLPTKNHKHL